MKAKIKTYSERASDEFLMVRSKEHLFEYAVQEIAELREALAAQYRELSNLVEMQPGGALYQPPTPVGYLFGNSYYEVGNPRLTDEIKRLGNARYGEPQAPSAPLAAASDEWIAAKVARHLDIQFRNGVTAGWNAGITEDTDALALLKNRVGTRAEYEAAFSTPSAPVAPDERALAAARAEGRAEAVLIIQSTEPETALEDCLSHSAGFDGEYDTFWDEEKLRAKFKVGDSTINMETKAEMAYYEYTEARMVLEYEAMQRRDLAAPNFEVWFQAAAAEYKAHDRDYSRKVWAAAALSCRAALSVKGEPAAIPGGWQIVPREPTKAMMNGAFDNISLSDAHSTYGVTEHVWAFMLSAAPTPPTTGAA